MKIQNLKKLAVCMMVAVLGVAGTVNGQETMKMQVGGGGQVRVAPMVAPPSVSTPRLGFMGQMIYGYGMRVLSTSYGTPAQMIGLERGDTIFWINGRRILCQFDYDTAMREAAMYRGGLVNLTVRNVRFDMGRSEAGSTNLKFKGKWGTREIVLNYNYYLKRGKGIPFLNPRNPRYRLAISMWKRLPLPVTRTLGPWFIRGIG